MDCFVFDAKYYTTVRDNDVLGNYKKYTAYYLHLMKGKPLHEMERFMDWAIEHKKINFNDPVMKVFLKDEHRDRYKGKMYLTQYLKEVKDRKLIMAPTLTCYLPQSQEPSLLAEYTGMKFNLRKKTKKEGQVARSYGRIQESVDKGNLQNKMKELINSISGALSIGSTPIANRSGHSTLTSTCRTATAFASANTERLLMGRRYFRDGLSVMENIVSIVADVDTEHLTEVMKKYRFHLITVDEMMSVLKYSYDSYWRSEVWENKIRELVEKLTPEQRSIYVYMGDFYHLREYNPEFVRAILDGFRDYENQPPLPLEEAKEEVESLDEFYSMFVTGMVAKHVGSLNAQNKDHQDKPYYGKIGASAKYVKGLLNGFTDYFHGFWSTKHLPHDTANFPDALRRDVLGGDTDSTLFTVTNWVEWYHGTDIVTDETTPTSFFIIYLLCMIIKHSLAMTSGQIGVEEEFIFMLKMKNEFFFESFSTSNRTKHYANLKSACEGIIYDEGELEIKGVALRNSKVPVEVMDEFNSVVTGVLEKAARNEMINMNELISHVATVEANIFNTVMHGDIDYLPSRAIKVKEAYTLPMSSDYAHHELWEAVFADKYGRAPEPPYVGVRISLDLPNRTAINMWLDNLPDQLLADRFKQFLQDTGRKAIASIILPYDTVAQAGIPSELKAAVNIRKIIYASTEPYYILLEMLGIYRVNKWLTRMCLDERLELLSPEMRGYFDDTHSDALNDIRSKASKCGKEYEDWDRDDYVVSEEDEDEDAS